jgi:hypothetical protein
MRGGGGYLPPLRPTATPRPVAGVGQPPAAGKAAKAKAKTRRTKVSVRAKPPAVAVVVGAGGLKNQTIETQVLFKKKSHGQELKKH